MTKQHNPTPGQKQNTPDHTDRVKTPGQSGRQNQGEPLRDNKKPQDREQTR